MQQKILHENAHYIVFNKPAGISTEEFCEGLFPAHRLDKDTSGVLIAARDAKAQKMLQRQFRMRCVKKEYIALVFGRLTPGAGAIEAGISRSMRDRKKMAVSGDAKARDSYTEYKVKAYLELVHSVRKKEALSLVCAFPHTGRTHQIRVHFSAIKHPVVGDEKYGYRHINALAKRICGLDRQFLHAHSIELIDPFIKKPVKFIASMPEDLQKTLKLVRCGQD